MSSLSMSRGRVPWKSRVALTLAVLAGIVVLGVVTGRVAASHYATGAIEALIAGPVLVAIFHRPALALVVLLIIVSSVFAYSVLPRANVPGHPPINLADLALAAMVGGTLWRRPWRTWPRPVRRYLVMLLAFLAVAGVATLKTALLGAVPARESLLAYRNFLYLGVAITLAVELGRERWMSTLNIAIAFAGILSILAIAAAALPSVAAELQRLNPVTVYSSNAVAASGGVALGSTARIRLTGLFFIYSMLAPTLVMILVVNDRRRKARIGAFLLMLAAVALSLNRNMYGGAAIAILLTILLGGAKVRGRLGLLIALTVISGVIVVGSSIAPAITAEVGKRANTILSPGQVLKSNSAKDRAYELSYAFPTIGKHPWFGIGPRQAYGAYFNGVNGTPRFYVQNLYVDLATDYGIPAAALFLLVPGVCLAFALRSLRGVSDPARRGLLAAFIGSTVSLLLSCLVDTFGQDPSSTVAIGTTCGFLLASAMAASTMRVQGRKGSVDVRAT